MTDVAQIAASLTQEECEAILSNHLEIHPGREALARHELAWNLAPTYDFDNCEVTKGGWQLRRLGKQIREHLEGGGPRPPQPIMVQKL